MNPVGRFAILAALALAVSVLPAAQATSAPPSYKDHEAWAVEHIEALPNEIRSRVKALGSACGDRLAAAHGFALPVSNGQFLVLHYEALWCPRRGLVCKQGSCLHEVYAQSARGYTRVFSGFVDDETLFPSRGKGVNLHEPLRWDGKRFTPTSD
ncbi:MAG: hypothetical protein ACOY4O_16800 [Pseudomonadota bacterium]